MVRRRREVTGLLLVFFMLVLVMSNVAGVAGAS